MTSPTPKAKAQRRLLGLCDRSHRSGAPEARRSEAEGCPQRPSGQGQSSRKDGRGTGDRGQGPARSAASSTGARPMSRETRTVHIIGTDARVSKATLRPLQMSPANTLAKPRPVTSGKVGTTSRLARGETSDVRPNWSRAIVPSRAGRQGHCHVRGHPPRKTPEHLSNGAVRASMPAKARTTAESPRRTVRRGSRPRSPQPPAPVPATDRGPGPPSGRAARALSSRPT